MERLGHRIAFLATGDEIVNGDILDTNAPYLAQELINNKFSPGTRLIVSDDQSEMEQAIRFLLKDHEVLITMGGLGPTSDDRTRFAVSAATDLPLEFDQVSWDRIENKLKAYKIEVPPNNRQQCLFPKGAEIYPNPNGTASGCCIPYKDKLIFMIPGPPNECRPMFAESILPRLIKTNLQQDIHRQSWMLLGVSEGSIAESLDALVQGTDCDIGYRVSYPYLEVKLQSDNQHSFDELSAKIEAVISERVISHNKQTASELFLDFIQEIKESFSILDEATQGRLASILVWPETYKKLIFNGKKENIHIHLHPLSEYWEQGKSASGHAEMPITVEIAEKVIIDQIINIPLRGDRTPKYAVELACEFLLKNLKITLNSK